MTCTNVCQRFAGTLNANIFLGDSTVKFDISRDILWRIFWVLLTSCVIMPTQTFLKLWGAKSYWSIIDWPHCSCQPQTVITHKQYAYLMIIGHRAYRLFHSNVLVCFRFYLSTNKYLLMTDWLYMPISSKRVIGCNHLQNSLIFGCSLISLLQALD